MELQNGRPETTSGRLDKEIRVYDLLDKLGIAYQRVDHEATMTMEACEEVDRILGDDGEITYEEFHPIVFDTIGHGYFALGDRVGDAFSEGNKLK